MGILCPNISKIKIVEAFEYFLSSEEKPTVCREGHVFLQARGVEEEIITFNFKIIELVLTNRSQLT